MSNSVKIILKIFSLLIYLIILLFILENHYVAIGECAARVYYYPLGRCDYLWIPLVGIVMLSISLYLIHTSKRLRIIEMFIYTIIIIITLLWGNDMLASRTVYWPDTYKVKSIDDLNP